MPFFCYVGNCLQLWWAEISDTSNGRRHYWVSTLVYHLSRKFRNILLHKDRTDWELEEGIFMEKTIGGILIISQQEPQGSICRSFCSCYILLFVYHNWKKCCTLHCDYKAKDSLRNLNLVDWHGKSPFYTHLKNSPACSLNCWTI